MTLRVRAAAGLLALGLLAGCGAHADPLRPTEFPAATGPLDLGRSGGQALAVPQHVHGTWSGTFGGFDVCARSSSSVTLTGVTFDTTGLTRVQALVHQVSPAAAAAVPAQQRWRYGPFGSTVGAPPRFDGSPSAPLGSYWASFDDFTVPPCTQNRRWSEQLGAGKVPGGTYTELVVTATAGVAGGRVGRARVDFTMDGEPGRETLPWTMILCGSDPALRSYCH